MALYLESVPLRCALGAAIAATLVASTQLPSRAPEPLTVCQYHVAHPTQPTGPRHAYVITSTADAAHERLAAVVAMTIAERTDWQLHLGLEQPAEPGHHLWVDSGVDVGAGRITCNATITTSSEPQGGGDRRVLLGTAQVELTPDATDVARDLARDACVTSAMESATVATIEWLERGVHAARRY